MFQRLRLAQRSSGSTLSVAMVISGRSVSRLVSRICFGSSGRNGRKQ